MARGKFLNWLTRQRVPTAQLQFRSLAGETRWLLGFAALYIIASAATGIAIRAFPMPLWGAAYFTQDIWYVVGFKLILLLALPLVVFRRWGYKLGDLLDGWKLTPRALVVLVICYLAGCFINGSRIPDIKVAWALHPPSVAGARAAIGVVLPFLMAGIPEEVVYRGLLQTRLEASWGRIAAITVSVILFTAWHIPTRYFLARGIEGEAGDLLSVLVGTGAPVAVVGLILALAWDRWRNLPALIAIHAGIDSLPILASMLQSAAETYR